MMSLCLEKCGIVTLVQMVDYYLTIVYKIKSRPGHKCTNISINIIYIFFPRYNTDFNGLHQY